MTIDTKMINTLDGAAEIRDQIKAQMPNRYFPNNGLNHGPELIVTRDTVLSSRIATLGERYGNRSEGMYEWPHVIVYAQQGKIRGAQKGLQSQGEFIEANSERITFEIHPISQDYKALIEVRL